MKRSLKVLLLASTSLALTASAASAKGVTASVQGATVPGLPYRYVAIGPNSPYGYNTSRPPDKFTVVGRIDKRGAGSGVGGTCPPGIRSPRRPTTTPPAVSRATEAPWSSAASPGSSRRARRGWRSSTPTFVRTVNGAGSDREEVFVE